MKIGTRRDSPTGAIEARGSKKLQKAPVVVSDCSLNQGHKKVSKLQDLACAKLQSS